MSIYKGSFFANSHIDPGKILRMAHLWLAGANHSTIQSLTDHSTATVTDYIGYFRSLIAFNLAENRQLIGGNGIIVEVDEAKFGRRKYNRGHRVDGAWVFGGVERTPERRMFALVARDRSAITLLNAIQENIHPGLIIYSDMWRGYANIEPVIGNRHLTVNHSQHFRDPETGVHTNTIEGTWNGFKIKIPARNRNEEQLDSSILEVIWRRQHSQNLWQAFIDCLRETDFQ